MRKITLGFLEKNNACQDGIEEVTELGLLGLPADRFVEGLIEHDKFYYANWLIFTLLRTKKREVMYSVYATELILDTYPTENIDKPREALRAAKAYLKNPSKRAADAAAAVIHPASIYNLAARAAYNTAYAASSKPYHNTKGAYAAVCYAIDAAERIGNNILKGRIIEYGLSLLK